MLFDNGLCCGPGVLVPAEPLLELYYIPSLATAEALEELILLVNRESVFCATKRARVDPV